ncbi:MAG: response regulator transcription factor [Propionibacteriaceae bacterium]|nr:response regulator transcription factor [Propionibacteriaceae bacterium]
MITVLVAEGHTAVREAFASTLNLHDDVTVVATAATIREGINLAWVHQPDAALIDVQLPNETGFAMVQQLCASVPLCRSIMLTSVDVPGHLRRAYDNGAWAYLTKDSPFADIVAAIKDVHSGRHLIDPKLVDQVDQSPLSVRETEVLRMVGRMGTTAQVAQAMHLSQGTVNNYISSILAKMHVASRVQALITARQNGWV